MSFETDIIVAGTGLAAYAAAIAAAERTPRLSVTLVGRPGPIPPLGLITPSGTLRGCSTRMVSCGPDGTFPTRGLRTRARIPHGRRIARRR